ncbi:hypothetical protein CSE45_4609 [Citreicella sp. SE45]|nr:hypothetical protein CSE45_4609 [Citreicella sp. SE45]
MWVGWAPCVRHLKRAPHDLRGSGRRSISSIIFSWKTSAGVLHPRPFRGVLLSWSQSCVNSSSVMAATSRCLGCQRRSRRLAFSTVPFCQGEEGSQNHVWVPTWACRCGHDTNSVPRSKVMDLRPATGRSRTAFTILSLSADCFAIACRAGHDRFRAPVEAVDHRRAAQTAGSTCAIGRGDRKLCAARPSHSSHRDRRPLQCLQQRHCA